jgi:non-canonical poly(A) RNA polymerase PAPD5/7
MKRYFPEFKYLVFVFKCMLRVRSLSDTYTGGVGSFLLFCMILVYLYEVHRDRKYYTLGEHVLKFMTFYGERDWSNKTILVREGIIADRVKDWNAMFSIVSPQDPSHDVGKAAFKIKDVFRVFKNRVQFINGKNFQPKESLLKILINPSDEKFRYSS